MLARKDEMGSIPRNAEGRKIMEARLNAERKAELESKLKKDKHYVVVVTTKFTGKFSHIEDRGGVPYAVFIQAGRTDRGGIPTRAVPVNHIISTGLIKHE